MDLPVIKKQAEAATPEPWWRRRDIDFSILGPPDDEHGGDLVIARASVNEDAEFIAAARTNVPMLVAALEEAQGEARKLRHWARDVPGKRVWAHIVIESCDAILGGHE